MGTDYERAREELKPYLQGYVQSITAKSKGLNKYVCPICGSGEKKDGAFTVYPRTNTVYCFSCLNNHTGKRWDIIDLYQHLNGITEQKQAVKELCGLYGVNYPGADAGERKETAKKEPPKPTPKQEPIEEKITDFSNFYYEAQAHIKETDYPAKRGLSDAIISKFCLGYVANWRHPNTPKAPASPRLIIPITHYSYIARDTREHLTQEQETYKKQKAKGKEGASWIFYRKALGLTGQPIFCVEGEIDALSIMEVGGLAVGLGSIANIKQFLKECEERQPKEPLIICLDSDAPGQKAQEELAEGLQELNIPFLTADINGAYKDANEHLTADQENFTRIIKETIARANEEFKKMEEPQETKEKELTEEERQAEKEKIRQDYKQAHSVTPERVQAFIDNIPNTPPPQKTGFKGLDELLEGGLYSKCLYVVGAISSLGKTTFCMQIADQIAAMGQDVIIFSLEMAAEELIAKSISRETYIHAMKIDKLETAKTQTGIENPQRWGNYRQADIETIQAATDKYISYSEHIEIWNYKDIEKAPGTNLLEKMETIIKDHISIAGNRPTVIIDYLQILALIAQKNSNGDTKAKVDISIWGFKEMAVNNNLPIIVISSFNRDNYETKANLACFKESGNIEYSVDCAIALQLKGVGASNFNADAAMQKKPREIELVILKGRKGTPRATVNYNYYSLFNYYQEAGIEQARERKRI